MTHLDPARDVKFQKEKAGLNVEYDQKNILPKAVVHELKPLYVRLTDHDLGDI